MFHWTWEENVYCPETHQCQDSLVSYDFGKVPGYLNIISTSLSCLGSVFIVAVYIMLKDMRTGAQTVMTLLAIADFFIAFSYMIGSVNFNTAFGSKDPARCAIFISICEIQSFITTWSTMSSFCWTCILAFYFFLVLVYRKGKLAERLLPFYNVIAWLGPLCIVGPMLVFGKLGYAPYVTSNWCFIKDYSDKPLIKKPMLILYILLGRKFWEIISYIIVFVLYIWIRWNIRKSPTSSDSSKSSSKTVEKWLLGIPVFYIILRMWGTLQFFYALAVSGIPQDEGHPGCIPQAIQIGYFIIAIFQAVGDGGQGWANALLLVIFSKTVHKRIFVNPWKKFSGYVQKTTSSSQSRSLLHTQPEVFSEPSPTAPTSDRISYPSNTYCIISHTNHSDFTSAHPQNGPSANTSETDKLKRSKYCHCCCYV